MYKARENFKAMTKGFKAELGFEEISELSNYYKETKNQRCIAYIYIDQFGHLYNQAKKFNLLDNADKVSIILVKIEEALIEFEYGKGAKLQTLISRYVYRDLYRENSSRGYDKRAINYNDEISTSYELYTEQGIDWGEEDTYNLEYYDLINSLDLTENEKMYCKIIGRNKHKLTDTEIAKEIGITPAAINYMKKRLKVKLKPIMA